ncbi:hypothetical protein HOP50_14g72500 [Chloropicon primus]|uniref:von Hippel-Lindau disease tumour suppressor beta domain-containing protein n=1 Tax=Chloropicon primus TaxID=1764295 RepID=A0A5B8MZ74_9CHLO|nr:hypothetical protein A3770_14p72320 [Chloropicon primus]UPR03919.1 hypothetical protein HOP50_14g72500 [Chloropicon primus]|eukprot:QDZ24714.1 hypothetical protein A3770_14p72320 [Chloropicon primus]
MRRRVGYARQSQRRGSVTLAVVVACVSLFLSSLPWVEGTVYFVPGLHNHHERYGVLAREQPPSGESGALREIKRSRVDVVRMPITKIVSQAKAPAAPGQGEAASTGVGSKRVVECSSLTGPHCFKSFSDGLKLSQYQPKFPLQGVHEVTEESLQLTILSSPGDVLILFYMGGEPSALELRKHFVKAGLYLQGQIDVAAIDCSTESTTGISSYCKEVREGGGTGSVIMLKHFRRLSDNFYTIHSKAVESKTDLSIHDTIEFLRSPPGHGEDDPRKMLQHSKKRMLVVRNRSTHTVRISWEIKPNQERTYYELVPGASQLVNVFVSQKWLIREKTTKAVVKEVVVKPDMTMGGVTLHIVTDETVTSGIESDNNVRRLRIFQKAGQQLLASSKEEANREGGGEEGEEGEGE